MGNYSPDAMLLRCRWDVLVDLVDSEAQRRVVRTGWRMCDRKDTANSLTVNEIIPDSASVILEPQSFGRYGMKVNGARRVTANGQSFPLRG